MNKYGVLNCVFTPNKLPVSTSARVNYESQNEIFASNFVKNWKELKEQIKNCYRIPYSLKRNWNITENVFEKLSF